MAHLIHGDWLPDLARQGEGERQGPYGGRRPCCVSHAGTEDDSPTGRQTGCQCRRRGSGPVVAGGVTPTQGGRAMLPQGEGVSTSGLTKAGSGSTRLPHGPRRKRHARRAATRRQLSQCGTPDALKGACPVWGGLGGNRRKVWRPRSTPSHARVSTGRVEKQASALRSALTQLPIPCLLPCVRGVPDELMIGWKPPTTPGPVVARSPHPGVWSRRERALPRSRVTPV